MRIIRPDTKTTPPTRRPPPPKKKEHAHLVAADLVDEVDVLLRREVEAVPQEGRDVRRHEAVLGEVLDVLLVLVAPVVVGRQLLVRHAAHASALPDELGHGGHLVQVQELPQLVVSTYVSYDTQKQEGKDRRERAERAGRRGREGVEGGGDRGNERCAMSVTGCGSTTFTDVLDKSQRDMSRHHPCQGGVLQLMDRLTPLASVGRSRVSLVSAKQAPNKAQNGPVDSIETHPAKP